MAYFNTGENVKFGDSAVEGFRQGLGIVRDIQDTIKVARDMEQRKDADARMAEIGKAQMERQQKAQTLQAEIADLESRERAGKIVDSSDLAMKREQFTQLAADAPKFLMETASQLMATGNPYLFQRGEQMFKLGQSEAERLETAAFHIAKLEQDADIAGKDRQLRRDLSQNELRVREMQFEEGEAAAERRHVAQMTKLSDMSEEERARHTERMAGINAQNEVERQRYEERKLMALAELNVELAKIGGRGAPLRDQLEAARVIVALKEEDPAMAKQVADRAGYDLNSAEEKVATLEKQVSAELSATRRAIADQEKRKESGLPVDETVLQGLREKASILENDAAEELVRKDQVRQQSVKSRLLSWQENRKYRALRDKKWDLYGLPKDSGFGRR